MRTIASMLFLGLVTTSGCKWTDFDDLEAEAWVHTMGKPNTESTDFGVALARGARVSTSGGTLAAFATGQPQFFELGYATNGDAQSSAMLLTDLATVTSADLPVVIEDAATDEIALVAPSGGGATVLHGIGTLEAHSVQGVPQVDAATYLKVTPTMNLTRPAPLVGARDTVYGSYYDAPAAAPSTCVLQDAAGNAIQIQSVGAAQITGGAEDDVVVWGTIGSAADEAKLMIFPGSIFHGCATPTNAVAEVSTPFEPALGSKIVMVDPTHALLVGHKGLTQSDAFLALYDVSGTAGVPQTPTAVGSPVTMLGLRTAAVLDLGAQKYVVAGYPNEVIDGVKAGRVVAFPLSLTTGVGDVPEMVLHDAQPEDEQAFGRSVAVTSFNGRPVIAVAADNEVFLYFRTTLYDETRQR